MAVQSGLQTKRHAGPKRSVQRVGIEPTIGSRVRQSTSEKGHFIALLLTSRCLRTCGLRRRVRTMAASSRAPLTYTQRPILLYKLM
jgi:hypothetical protein